MPRRAAAFLIALASLGPAPAAAAPKDATLFVGQFAGEWRGTGKVLFGPQRGLKFHCALNGLTAPAATSFRMTGRCWSGLLSAKVHAELRYDPKTRRFQGGFMGGAKGDGVDIVGGRRGKGFSLQLSRGAARGELAATPVNDGQMRVSILLTDPRGKRSIPVVAMGFARPGETSLPLYEPAMTSAAP